MSNPPDVHHDELAQHLQHVIDDELTETAVSNSSAAEANRARDEQLDNVRIRQLATLRRGAYRSRSHAVIAMVVCAIGGVQLGMMGWHEYRSGGLTGWAVGYLLLFAVAAVGCLYFFRRAIALHAELHEKISTPPPEQAPDFSTLGDGSDQWKKLEDVE